MKTNYLRLVTLSFVACGIGALIALLLQPTYLLDWPASERQGASLFIDGRKIPLSRENPLRIRVNWFAERMVLRRDGYQSLSFELHGETPLKGATPIRPPWIPTETQQLRYALAGQVEKLRTMLSANTELTTYGTPRSELSDLAARLRPGIEPEHNELAVTIQNLLDQVPHPLDRLHDLDHSGRLWGIGSQVLCHSKPVLAVAVSPDGKLVASGSADGGILIHLAVNGQQVMSLFEHTAGITSLAFHPSSNSLFSTSYDGRVLQWDLRSKKSRVLASGPGAVTQVIVSTDGKSIAYDASTRKVTLRLLDEDNTRWQYVTQSRVRQLHFVPELQQLAILHEQALEMVDLADGTLVNRVRNSVEARRLTFNAGLEEIRLIGDETTMVWSSSRNKESFRFQTQPGLLGVSPDRSWLAEFQRRKPASRVKLNWEDKHHFLPIGQRFATCIDFHPEHQLAATGTAGGGLFIHRLAPFVELTPVPPRVSWHTVTFDPTGDRLVLVSGSGAVAIVDCHTRRLTQSIEGNGVHPRQLLVSRATDTLWIEDSFGLRGFALDASGRKQQIDGARCAAMTADGRYLAFTRGVARAMLTVLDLQSGRESTVIENLSVGVEQMVFGQHERVLYALDKDSRPIELNLEQATVEPLESALLETSQNFELLHWIGGRLFLVDRKSIYALDLSNDRFDKVTLEGDVAALAGCGWSKRWLAVTPGQLHKFNDLERTSLQLGSLGQRYSSITLSPCCRYFAIALGDGRVELYPFNGNLPSTQIAMAKSVFGDD